jgi:hypothetical protein
MTITNWDARPHWTPGNHAPMNGLKPFKLKAKTIWLRNYELD